MDTIKIEHKGNTQMVAHRGASALERENTVAAFLAAANRSYWGIETDVHRTADGGFVLFHDDRTGRVAPTDIPVESSTLADLRALKLYDTHGLATRGDLVIPVLEEYAAICRDYRKVAVLELKNAFSPEDIAKIVLILAEQGALEQTLFISFDLQNLIELRKLLPTHPVQFLTGKLTDEVFEILVREKMDLDVHYSALTKEWIDRLHGADIEVNCWTVDDPEACRRLIDWGVDYITSNRCE
ncbi:MAG: hypothetical protein J6R82_02495 [Clostridia bacterium]|nr:hypothetical protein [Clostridia bacterium]